MTDLKESKKKKCLRTLESFYRVLSKNEEEMMVKPQKVNLTVDPRQKPDLINSFDIPSHDQTSGSQNNINYQYLMNSHYGNESRSQKETSKINSTLWRDPPLRNEKSKNNLSHSEEYSGKQYPIKEEESYEKLLKGVYFENQKSKNFKKKKQQLKQVNKQQKHNHEAQRQYKKKIPKNFNPLKNEIQNTGYFNNEQDDEEISEIVHKIECSQIETQQIEPYFPEIKSLRKILTSEQLKVVICDTIREEIKRAKNPLLSSQEKFKLHERHRDLANNLNKNRIVFNQNIIQGGRKSGSNRNHPPYDDFSFGDDQNIPQNYDQNQLRSSKGTSQKLFEYAMNLRDTDPQNFKQFSQKFKANSKTQKDKKTSHNAKVIFGTIATIGGIGIKVATDVQKHYRQTSTSIQSNIMSCGKAMVGGAVGKMLANKINPKLRNYGALIGVLATSEQAKSRMAKLLQKTGKYLHRFDEVNEKTDDTNEHNLQGIVQQEFIYEQNQRIRDN